MRHISIKFCNINKWKLLVFSGVFMLMNGSEGLLAVILSLMISRACYLRKHLRVLMPFPCPAISHYFGRNQKPNSSPLRFCHSPQPLCSKDSHSRAVFRSIPRTPRAAQHRGRERWKGGSTCGAKAQRCTWQGRQAVSETWGRRWPMDNVSVFVSEGKKRWQCALRQSLGES